MRRGHNAMWVQRDVGMICGHNETWEHRTDPGGSENGGEGEKGGGRGVT